MQPLDSAGQFARYLIALRAFLRTPLDPARTLDGLRSAATRREETFLGLVAADVFANPRSLTGALFRHAGIGREDVERLVRADGLEPALARLHEAGVRLTVDELRGRAPVVRDGRELSTAGLDVRRSVVAVGYRARTGGSRSAGVPVAVDLGRPEAHAAYHLALLRAFGLERPATAIWFPAPPSVAGLSSILSHAKLGMRVERWFSQTAWRREAPRDVALTAATLAVGRVSGVRIPRPEHTTAGDADRVARWLAETRAKGLDATLVGTPSGAVRVCAAARENDLDLTGALFRVNGEPLTPPRASEIQAVGARAASGYYVAEAGGAIGVACAHPVAVDDVHVVVDRAAVVQPSSVEPGTSGPLAVTTFDPRGSTLLLNLELGDEGILVRRRCGCGLGRLGFGQHVHTIRSAKKLTSEGMSFAGSELIQLLEVVLPGRFGGSATDYQLVERAQPGGLIRVALVASPRVAASDAELLEAVRAHLGSLGRGHRMMAAVWDSSGTLTIERRDPYVTAGAKTPSVHRISGAEDV